MLNLMKPEIIPTRRTVFFCIIPTCMVRCDLNVLGYSLMMALNAGMMWRHCQEEMNHCNLCGCTVHTSFPWQFSRSLPVLCIDGILCIDGVTETYVLRPDTCHPGDTSILQHLIFVHLFRITQFPRPQRDDRSFFSSGCIFTIARSSRRCSVYFSLGKL